MGYSFVICIPVSRFPEAYMPSTEEPCFVCETPLWVANLSREITDAPALCFECSKAMLEAKEC